MTRIMTILMATTLAAAAPAMAQSSGARLNAQRFGNFGPSSAAIGQANPGAQDVARPVDPNQVFSLPGFTPPSQTQPPNTPLFPNSNGIGQR
jgi:hypothetical protein